MTLKQAQEILKHPKFGNPSCIAAMQRVAEQPEIDRLQSWLVGKILPCFNCEGNDKDCNLCEEGDMKITEQLARSWDNIEMLRSVEDDVKEFARTGFRSH